ncbi:bifunctional diaminohydroxyphosphoribosylaminopyrimidine deaminase/5-amino-6-(5-phosphoribosylamino)uracil reductase RibD [Clostridium folliculivorans]|uniref:Riboflavin biosynthesis protein RibD n=1 Tax=Clostridium folliculivorans TaxID=2886038 RepID=A0A9W5Y447_9CLOT|nr:bifunctional diaminohydroxyphosphoribosylaminopyrimidine deaminase/5-amino-6-(5-phosphoribosylamino)uracil reductase RibD [Clostridium folliculivorans]GKU26168.1 riboflavin biosynthesis protein RibD [Clostridium folliculivorans]GKU31840.1 riboflavin biosynthesis protein RibD [Clostridium folliculivorans]
MIEVYMKKAIDIANRGSGFVNPDPLVGAILVKNEKIVGQGWYKFFGSERAEVMAIKSAGEDTRDSELFINIEPEIDEKYDEYISFILNSGIKRIYIGIPNPRVGRGGKAEEVFKPLGIEIEYGVLKNECEELNEIYTHYINTGTPFVFTKWAMTLDGKLASRTGDSKWISSEKSLEFVHHLRQRVAAIMVGENTVRLDNPLLTTRLEGVVISNPLRVIVSKYGDIPLNSNILKVDANTRTLIIASEKIAIEKEVELKNYGVDIIKLRERQGKIQFEDIVKALGERNIDSLYIEGGSSLLASAFESRVVNKVYAAIAPKIIGGKDAITPVGGVGIEKMNDAIRLSRVTHQIIGDDVIFKGYI